MTMKHKPVYTLEEVAQLLDVSITQVKDFIWNRELDTVGSRREHVRHVDLVKFIGGELISESEEEH